MAGETEPRLIKEARIIQSLTRLFTEVFLLGAPEGAPLFCTDSNHEGGSSNSSSSITHWLISVSLSMIHLFSYIICATWMLFALPLSLKQPSTNCWRSSEPPP